jgi:hypothetical protein
VEEGNKDREIDELKAKVAKLELQAVNLQNELEKKEKELSELSKNQERPVENDNFSLNLQDHQDDANVSKKKQSSETSPSLEEAQQETVDSSPTTDLTSFLSHPKVSGSILTASLLIIGGLI